MAATVPYLTFAEAQTECFDEFLDTVAWDAAADPRKTTALQVATRMINQLAFIGSKSDPDQDNEFPRDASDNEIPIQVKRATCHQALALLQGRTLEKFEKQAGVAAESVGDASVTYGSAQGKLEFTDMQLGLTSSAAARELREWVIDPRRIIIDRV